jgi:Armadillo/beta-catenin-like repeat
MILNSYSADNPGQAENKLLIVKLGGLEPLIRQMLSPNVEVQCNAVGCVTNLATHGIVLDILVLGASN